MYPSTDFAPGRELLSPPEWGKVERRSQLSNQELEIVKSIFDDETEERIARRLKVSKHTVHTYIYRVFRKLGVRSRTQLIVRVVCEVRQENDRLVP